MSPDFGPTKPKAVLFDMDGTLVDVSEIRHLVDPTDPKFEGRKQFDRFHSESINSPAHRRVVDAFIAAKTDGLACIVVTARAEKHRAVTHQWLRSRFLFPDQQLHRPDGDFRPDAEIKRDMLRLLRDHYEIVEVWDDNPRVIRMWKSEGLHVNIMPGWPVRDGKIVEAGELEAADSASPF